LVERPVHLFTKLLLRPIAFFASLDWEIGRNRAKVSSLVPVAVLSAQQLHGRQEELT
jgi:hypothetical protein